MDSYTELKFTGSRDNFSHGSGKSVLHFSDGVLDLDDLEEPVMEKRDIHVDPQKLSWAPWVWYCTATAGSRALQVCDYFGEALAAFFGITTPKYQYEISEYNRMKKEEEERNDRDLEQNTWSNGRQSFDHVNDRQDAADKNSQHYISTTDIESKF